MMRECQGAVMAQMTWEMMRATRDDLGDDERGVAKIAVLEREN